MDKLRVLLVGAAFSADLHSDGYSRLLDKVQIVGICDRDTDRVDAPVRVRPVAPEKALAFAGAFSFFILLVVLRL